MKKENYRKQLRRTLLNQRKAKIETAKFAFECALGYYRNNNIPGVVYWENECKRALAEAGSIRKAV